MSTKKKHRSLPSFTAEARDEAKTWLEANRSNLPPGVIDAVTLSIKLGDELASVRRGRNSIVKQLRVALGIIPSSERRKNCDDPLAGAPEKGATTRLSPEERLIDEHDRSQRLSKWYRRLAGRHGRRVKDCERKLMELKKLEEVELTPEELAEYDRLDAEHEARLALGARCDLDCVAPAETLMTGMATHVAQKEVDCKVDRDELPRGAEIKQRFVEERERVSFSFSVTQLTVNVEKVSVTTKDGTTLIAASVEDIGPPKSRVTWEFLASMAIMVSQYAMPMNRFAALASSSVKEFKANEMSRYFRYVALRLCSVYLELGHSLANAAVLSGDDTGSRVIEVTKGLAVRAVDPSTKMPWHDYATAEAAARTLEKDDIKPTLALILAKELGFESERKDGKGAKRDFNTTVISGRTNLHDPRSTIVFYRSHLGGFGNLLTRLLADRDPDNRDIVIQSDLSTVNLISDSTLRDQLRVQLAGCSFHARRPFAQYEDHDPDFCSWILHLFKGLSIYEHGLDVAGRNRENTNAVRGSDVQKTWDDIKGVAAMIAGKWSRETELGDGARYILRHIDRLTYYLHDPRVGPTNNFSERMLRMERLIENNALFRQKLEGRFALDVVRSVLQTAVAAKVNLTLYLNWLLRMPQDVVDADPAEFTPLAFAQVESATP